MKTYNILGYEVVLEVLNYRDNNAIYIGANDAVDGESVCDITVNVDGVVLAENEILVKNYSENEGVVNDLIREGIATLTGREIQTGWVKIPVMKLTEEFIKITTILK